MSDAENNEQHEHVFESSNAGASLTYPMQCSALRKGGHVVIKGRPCKTGKHGHAKVNLVATDIFTTKKYEDISPSTHNMDVPNISKSIWTVINIDDGFLNLMDQTNGATKDDVRVPDGDKGDELVAAFESLEGDKEIQVTIVKAMGEEHCVEYKV